LYGKVSNILQKVNVTIVSRELCHDKYINSKRPMNISQDMMCAGEQGKDSCQGMNYKRKLMILIYMFKGDSGGPCICQMPDTREKVQCGVVSFGYGCGSEYPGVYADILYFRSQFL
jgi:secreted trypsin-like serine protease